MAWYTPILWFLVGIGFGILAFLAGPVLLGPHLPRETAERIAGYYDRLAMKTAERLLNVRRRIGAYSPEPSSYDGEKGGEKVTLDGETHHFFDTLGLMGTFHARPFGMVLEGLGVIVDPFIAAMTDYERPRAESGEWLIEDEDGELRYDPEVAIPETPMLAEIRNAAAIIPGSMDSRDPTTAETLFEKSQILFGKPKTKDVMVLIVAWGVGIGAYIALQYVTGGGGTSAPSLPAFPAVIVPW